MTRDTQNNGARTCDTIAIGARESALYGAAGSDYGGSDAFTEQPAERVVPQVSASTAALIARTTIHKMALAAPSKRPEIIG